MSTVTISINSREYAIACEDGEEAHLLKLSRLLDEKAALLTQGSAQISENMLLTMIALLLADELNELKKDSSSKEPQVNMAPLSALDTEMATSIKSLDEKLKMLAKEINLL